MNSSALEGSVPSDAAMHAPRWEKMTDLDDQSQRSPYHRGDEGVARREKADGVKEGRELYGQLKHPLGASSEKTALARMIPDIFTNSPQHRLGVWEAAICSPVLICEGIFKLFASIVKDVAEFGQVVVIVRGRATRI